MFQLKKWTSKHHNLLNNYQFHRYASYKVDGFVDQLHRYVFWQSTMVDENQKILKEQL